MTKLFKKNGHPYLGPLFSQCVPHRSLLLRTAVSSKYSHFFTTILLRIFLQEMKRARRMFKQIDCSANRQNSQQNHGKGGSANSAAAGLHQQNNKAMMKRLVRREEDSVSATGNGNQNKRRRHRKHRLNKERQQA